VSHVYPLSEFKTAMRAKWNGEVSGGCVLHPSGLGLACRSNPCSRLNKSNELVETSSVEDKVAPPCAVGQGEGWPSWIPNSSPRSAQCGAACAGLLVPVAADDGPRQQRQDSGDSELMAKRY